MQKNIHIQFWRIVFTYVIAYYHLLNAYRIYTSWYIAVEFFFIVSGYLLANKFLNMKDSGAIEGHSAWEYTYKRFKRLFPHCLFAFLVAFVIKGVYAGYVTRDWIREFLIHIPEIFLVQMSGLNLKSNYPINSPTWYLSVLLIAGFFIWALMKKTDRIYVNFICPLSVLLIYPYLYRTYGFIGEHWEVNNFIFNSALLRGFADMNLGILACAFVRKYKIESKIRMEIVSDVFLLVGGILGPMLYCRSYYDYMFLFFIFIGVVTGFSADTISLGSKAIWFIEKWALITPSIYINHKIFRSIFTKIWPEPDILVYVVWFVFITVYSIITYLIVEKAVKLLKGHMPIRITVKANES